MRTKFSSEKIKIFLQLRLRLVSWIFTLLMFGNVHPNSGVDGIDKPTVFHEHQNTQWNGEYGEDNPCEC